MAEPAVAEAPPKTSAGALLAVRDLQAWYGESHILHGVGFEIGRASCRERVSVVV